MDRYDRDFGGNAFMNRTEARSGRYRDARDFQDDRYDRDDDRDRPLRHRDDNPNAERPLIERASDEVRSWFGDEQAQRRREMERDANDRGPGRWRDRGDDADDRWRSRSAGPRGRYDEDERVHDIMTNRVITVEPNDPVERAAWLMRENDCGAIPVVTESGRVIGMITDRDITVRLVATGRDLRHAVVEDAMTQEVHAVHMYDSLEACHRVMSRHQVRRVPVVDDRDRVVGVVSQADLARHAGRHRGRGERREVADTLHHLSEPSRRPRA